MIHQDASADRLAVARIVVFGIWFFHIATTKVTNYTLLPPEAVESAGLLAVLPLPALLASEPLLVTMKTLGLALTFACVLGVRPWRPVAIAALVMIVWHDGSMKSILGFVNHAQAATLFAAVVLAASPAADGLSIHRRRLDPGPRWRYGGPLFLAALIVATAYSLIGLRRLVYGGVGVFTDGSIERWVAARSQQYAAYDFAFGSAVLEVVPRAGTLLAVGMFVVTVFEAVSVLTLRSRRLRVVWLGVLVPFHVSSLVLMNIFFWENLLLLLVLFTGSIDRVRAGSRSRTRSRAAGRRSATYAVPVPPGW